jgi:tetratricopeptide (TPR) repeat protein
MQNEQNNYLSIIHTIEKLFISKKFNEALIKINKLLKRYPHSEELLNFKSIILLEHNRYSESISTLNLALKINNRNPFCYLNMANVFMKQGNYNEAISFYNKSLDLDKNPNTYINLASALFKLAKFQESIEVLNTFFSFSQDNEVAHQLFASNCREMHDYVNHKKHLEIAINLNPNNYENYFHLGFYFQSIGNFDHASKYYSKSIQLNNLHGESIFNLHKLNNFLLFNEAFHPKKILNHFQDSDTESKSYIYLLLSEFYLRRKEYKFYHKYLKLANKLKANLFPFNIQAEVSHFDKVKKIFSKLVKFNLFDINDIDYNFQPIFIVGMPRSGSSLVEQMISNDNRVFGGGEIAVLYSQIYNAIENHINHDELLSSLKDIKKNYISHVMQLTKHSLITDKLPLNFKYLGIIKLLFPNSKFILTTRNKSNNFFSIYKNFFSGFSLNFANNSKDIVHFYNLYLDYLTFWNESNIEYHTHNLDEFINSKNKHLKSLFSYLNLKFKDEYLDIKKNQRAILTASNTQLRGEISQNQGLVEMNDLHHFFPEFLK